MFQSIGLVFFLSVALTGRITISLDEEGIRVKKWCGKTEMKWGDIEEYRHNGNGITKGWIAMSVERVKEHLAGFGREKDILTLSCSTATVELAAAALGVEPARIAKTLCFKSGEGAMAIVAAGDVRIDNAKFKAEFGGKARMLAPEEVPAATGYEVGGVCPFGLPEDVPVYLDISLKRFKTVFPACGSSNTAIELTCAELAEYSGSKRWVDVGKR